MPRHVSNPSYELAQCVVCGHANATVVADTDDIRAEVELLWEYHEARLRPGIPPVHLIDRVAFSQHPAWRLVRCVDCGLVYRNPAERNYELTEIYARQTSPPDVLRGLHDTQQAAVRTQARELRRVLGRGGSGLEVGSYVGAFLSVARESGLQIEGLDINADVNAFTRSLGFVVHDGDLASFEQSRVFDTIAIWNTFDQLADPRGTVLAAWTLLRPGGVLAIRVPNGAFYSKVRRWLRRGRLRRMAATTLLANNNLLAFPYRWGFSVRSLGRLLGDAGFIVERVRGDVLVPIGDEWTRRWARREEMLIKRLMTTVARRRTAWAPWIEVYARRERAAESES